MEEKKKNFILEQKKLSPSGQKGFTLMELVVGIGLFILIVGAAAGTLVYTIRVQRILLARQSISSELSFNMEYMSRALRMAVPDDGTCGFNGEVYHIDGSSLQFVNHLQDNSCQEFYLGTGGEEKEKLYYRQEMGAEGIPLVSQKVESLEFVASDAGQPKVTILMELKAGEFSDPFRLQTTVSSRNLSI